MTSDSELSGRRCRRRPIPRTFRSEQDFSHHSRRHAMKPLPLLLILVSLTACVVDPTARNSTAERNAAAEEDLNRGIVCKRQSSGDFELSRTECTTPEEREQRRDAGVDSDLERK